MRSKTTFVMILSATLLLAACGRKDTTPTANTTDSTNNTDQRSAPSSDTKPVNNMIRSVNQPAGTIIYVREIFLEYPGYVALHRLNDDGSLGDMIGITHAIEGNKEQIDVTITETISNGETLAVVMYKDDGDIEFNDPETDTIVTGDDGSVIQSTITIDDSQPPALEQK